MTPKQFIINKYPICKNRMHYEYFDKWSGNELVELIEEYLECISEKKDTSNLHLIPLDNEDDIF